ncbi:hypothetical protein P4575_27905, partial [Priestia megaterium]|uniref:hypothetical protein n=1 Tax=Priestia megaterium TaxID=1404 RepID=UPI002E1AF47E|nr:hypothetical protein [Priestia megaterium]
TDFFIPQAKFKLISKKADCFFTVSDNNVEEQFHVEFQLKNDKTMALRMYEYGLLKAATDAYFNNDTQKVVLPKQLVIFIEENKNIEDKLRLEVVNDGETSIIYIQTYKVWEDDILSLLTKKMYALLPFVPFSFRKEMEKVSNDTDLLTKKTSELMVKYYEIAEHLSHFYEQNELTYNDLDKLYNALNHITTHIFEKYGLDDIINKEVEKMVDTLWKPKVEKETGLKTFRRSILLILENKSPDYDKEKVTAKLDAINNEDKLIELLKLVGNDVQDFMNNL